MGINSTEVAYGFGQLGSGYLDDTDALTPPTGKFIVEPKWTDLLQLVLITVIGAYFGGRSLEKVKK